jgi:hypothetical protein
VGNIHKRLQKVYGDDAVDRSTVGRWAKRLSGKSGHADIHDLPRSGRPQSAHTDTIAERANNMIGRQTCNSETVITPTGHWGSKCAQNIGEVGLHKGVGKVGPTVTDRCAQGATEDDLF